MDEITMFKLLQPPSAEAGEISRAVRERVDRALVPTPPPPWRPRGRYGLLTLAGGLSAALAAGVAVVAVAGSGGSPPQAGVGAVHWGPASRGVSEVAYQTAAAAAAQPEVSPGQWEYWKEKQAGGSPDGMFQVWTTADSRRAAYVDSKGRVRGIAGCAGSGGNCDTQFIGQPAPFVTSDGTSFDELRGTIPVSYAGLSALPPTPRALLAHLAGLRFPHWDGWGPAPVRVFEILKYMLTTYDMPPALTAEAYRAFALIPGITIDRHAVDVAGRPGTGLSMALPAAWGAGSDVIIIDPATHQLAGQELLTRPHAGSPSHVLSGTAILRHAAVSGPGQLP